MILLISCCPPSALPRMKGVRLHSLNEMPSFLSAEQLVSRIRKEELESISLILLPGDFRELEKFERLVKIKCVLGPTYCANIALALANAKRLSKNLPAEKVLSKEIAAEVQKLLAREGKADFRIGNVGVGKSLRAKVIAEIVDAPLLLEKQLLARASYYSKSGADIIDVGMLAYRDCAEDVPRIFSCLKKCGKPLSIDSFRESEITAALDSGAKLVLSLCSENLSIASTFPKEVSAVVVPDAKSSLEQNIAAIRKLSGIKLIADPILRPLGWGFSSSLRAYSDFRAKNPMPMMMGAGNLTELVDSDSRGANALLAGISSELGIELMLTTEASAKTKGSVGQLARATRLMFAARRRNHPPKDMGIKL